MSTDAKPVDALSVRPLLQPHPSRMLLVLVIVLTGLGDLSTQIYVPSLPAIALNFGVGKDMVQHTLSAFILAYGLGQLVYGPLSDRFGRRFVLLTGLLIYLAATLACWQANSAEALIAARFAQGAGASAALVLARAITRDVWGAKAAPVLALATLAIAVCTMLSPLLGGTLSTLTPGWRTSFIFLVGLGITVIVLVGFGYQETHHSRDPHAIHPRRLLSNYGALLRDRSYMGFALVLAFTYGSLFVFISGAPLYIIGQLGLSPREYGLCFCAVVSGLCAGMVAARFVSPRWGIPKTLTIGLSLCLMAAVGALVISLTAHPSLATLLLPQLPLTFGAGLIMPNAVAGAVIPQGQRAGLAAGLIGFLQMVGGTVFGYLSVRSYAGSPTSMLIVQVGALALALGTFSLARRGRSRQPALTAAG
jgi:DHA1 family bicyclomycin/chloramphenicol resistance-like MFS transporter